MVLMALVLILEEQEVLAGKEETGELASMETSTEINMETSTETSITEINMEGGTGDNLEETTAGCHGRLIPM